MCLQVYKQYFCQYLEKCFSENEHVFFKKPFCNIHIFLTLSHSNHYGQWAVNAGKKWLCPGGAMEIAVYGAKDQFTVGLIL